MRVVPRSFAPVLVLVTLLAGCGPQRASDPEAAPLLTGKALDGEYWSSQDALGKVLLVNVWATWCGPCRDELPVLESIHNARSGGDFELVGVSVDSDADAEAVRAMAERYGLSYRVVLDPYKRVTREWQVRGYPTSVLLDRRGRPVWRQQGELSREHPELDAAIEAALRGDAQP